MPPPENEVTTLQHLLDLALIATFWIIGIFICCVLIGWVLRGFFRRKDAGPQPWYERNTDA